MSVQSQIDRINSIKQRIRTNLVAQGITVPEDTMLEEMAELILSVAGENGNDYVLTEADKAEIASLVIEMLGGNPIFGIVDADNHIILNGDLPDGTYSVKYEMDDGKTISIGNLVLDTNVYYSVTNNLTNCTSNNSATQAIGGQSYSATITANSGYELKSVTVTMGGSPVTVSGGKINIANVTGNIVITATAEVAGPAYTNQIPISTDASGNLFVGTNGEKGYKTGYRFSLSSGSETSASGYKISGFIPAKQNDVLRIKDIDLTDETATNIIAFDSAKQKLNGGTTTYGLGLYSFFVKNGTESNGVYKGTLSASLHSAFGAKLAYIRIGSKSITADSILTVNEEIV